MSRVVIISKTAEKKLEKLFNYLLEEWSLKVKNDFIKKLDKSIDVIKSKPKSFPESSINKGLRKCVVTKQISLFYRFDAKNIYILTLFDTRQHPNRLKKDFLEK